MEYLYAYTLSLPIRPVLLIAATVSTIAAAVVVVVIIVADADETEPNEFAHFWYVNEENRYPGG